METLTYLFKIFHLQIVLVCVPLWPLQNSAHQICLCKFSHLILRKIILLVFFLKVFPSVNFYVPFVMVNVLIFFLVYLLNVKIQYYCHSKATFNSDMQLC